MFGSVFFDISFLLIYRSYYNKYLLYTPLYHRFLSILAWLVTMGRERKLHISKNKSGGGYPISSSIQVVTIDRDTALSQLKSVRYLLSAQINITRFSAPKLPSSHHYFILLFFHGSSFLSVSHSTFFVFISYSPSTEVVFCPRYYCFVVLLQDTC